MEKKIKEIISKDFKKNVITIPWDGMHDEAVKTPCGLKFFIYMVSGTSWAG